MAIRKPRRHGMASLQEGLLVWPNVSWATRKCRLVATACPEYHSNNLASFDTIKVRLQTSQKTQFRGPIDCVMQTVRNEGFSGFYKGVTPPLVGWLAMDSM